MGRSLAINSPCLMGMTADHQPQAASRQQRLQSFARRARNIAAVNFSIFPAIAKQWLVEEQSQRSMIAGHDVLKPMVLLGFEAGPGPEKLGIEPNALPLLRAKPPAISAEYIMILNDPLWIERVFGNNSRACRVVADVMVARKKPSRFAQSIKAIPGKPKFFRI